MITITTMSQTREGISAVKLRNQDSLSSMPRNRNSLCVLPRKRESLYSLRSNRLSLNIESLQERTRKQSFHDLRSEKTRYLKEKAKNYRKVYKILPW